MRTEDSDQPGPAGRKVVPFQTRRILCAVLLLALTSSPKAAADDWPQWLGPNRDGVWRETGILESFPAGGPKTLWRTPIKSGYSGPAVAGGRVYITDRDRQLASEPGDPFARSDVPGAERVLCLNEADGRVLWQHSYPCRYTISYAAGPRVTPLIHDDKVYTLGAEGHLLCLEAKTGKVLWSRNFKADFNIKAPMWGFAGHPLIDGERIICVAGGSGTTAVAFDRNSGKEIWRALDASEPGYSSPVIYEAGGRRQLIILHAEAANSLDPSTGSVYWSVPFKNRMGLGVATPRKLGDLLFFTSFYDGSLMLKLEASDPKASVLWRSENVDERRTTHLNSIIPTPFLENGHIYGICSYGQLRCLVAATGERVWETLQATSASTSAPAAASGDKKPQPVRWGNAFLIKNGDRFFLFNEHGELIIAKLSPAGYEEISRARILEPTNRDPGRPVVWSHPAFANRRVYARNDREIVCVDLARP